MHVLIFSSFSLSLFARNIQKKAEEQGIASGTEVLNSFIIVTKRTCMHKHTNLNDAAQTQTERKRREKSSSKQLNKQDWQTNKDLPQSQLSQLVAILYHCRKSPLPNAGRGDEVSLKIVWKSLANCLIEGWWSPSWMLKTTSSAGIEK